MKCPSCGFENRPGARGCRRCNKALPTLVPGDVVSQRFKILGLLGTGGMGVVFKAFDRTLEETVALKTLRADIEATEDMVSRLRSEIRLARKVSSPNVCRIYEYGVDGDRHYISMEYVDGVTLRDLLHKSGTLPLGLALDIATQLVAGLVAIHDVGIMHRDPKPANLMRTSAGLVKLMDFGIAKEIGGATLTAAGHAVGTPEYMSPEHVKGQKLDLRTDVYIAGIVLFELVTGISPFRADTHLEAAHKQVTEMPDLHTPGIPAALVPVLSRSLAKDRDERYASARLDLDEAPLRTQAPPASPAVDRLSSTARFQAASVPDGPDLAALHSPDAAVRRRELLALFERQPTASGTVLALASALRDSDHGIRSLAAASLWRLGPAAEPAVPSLIEALEDETAGGEAAAILVKLGKSAVPSLLEVMRSGRDALRTHAATTLARIGAALAPPPTEH
jgi:serine/threonine protein kinase